MTPTTHWPLILFALIALFAAASLCRDIARTVRLIRDDIAQEKDDDPQPCDMCKGCGWMILVPDGHRGLGGGARKVTCPACHGIKIETKDDDCN